MVIQVRTELAGAVASRYKIERLSFSGLNGGHQGRFARHGDGRGWQTTARVGVPGRVGLEVAAAQVAIKCFAQAVNNGGVGLQQHADAQAVVKNTRNHGAIAGAARFFFNDAGQNQRFVW